MSEPLKEFDLLATLSELLRVSEAEIQSDTNLIELGLDSISLMRLTGRLRQVGIEVNFAQLMNSPTFSSWQTIIFTQRHLPKAPRTWAICSK
ncbi:phosphopantetheine-binding protein [Vibrio vulnificus]|uniref:phosphopantetheine-binding protein n=1 Tax=Vibrio vulnificus TaxID=672 RepID=UPI0019D434C2|nr:phosphopantetheine-binding protein [Vibrio vulnificus]MBN8144408.1 acyl carrier protein [Vibrio vulnificus]HAS6159486.1 acyl carrier protein [Vibrio vulnificus]HAS6184827.1 acyl carrier protein [Vibrio vulnificus]HAS6298131.1 acyl carrier protein [Vibrio vulnificus]HDY7471425.1 acyl carrier protein [Vibrio vulnificus]